ncbi:hypothetical protein AA313_de0203493 [Arthrobotrys entomopaga]|nr:hypothetical protein AA313_de0203493 [Arthrobotrys entomopaga]
MSAPKICFEWRANRCRRPNCRYTHDESAVEQCRAFQRSRNCKFGPQCKFGHYIAAPGSTSSQNPGPTPSSPTETRRVAVDSAPPAPLNPLQSWRKICRIRGQYSAIQMKTFLEGALKLIQENNEIENVQQVIKELSETENVQHIQQLLEANLDYNDSMGTINFLTHAVTFLRIINNSEFQGSIVVERYAGTVYNVIHGVQGSRGNQFFQQLLSRSQTLMGEDPQLYTEVLPMIVSALKHTIQLNSNALINEGTKQVAREALSQAKEQGLLLNPELRTLHQHFKIINEQLQLGEKIPSLIPEKTRGTGIASFFSSYAGWLAGGSKGIAHANLHPAVQANVRLPGDLSDMGPRHDNDHASIDDIRILPTADEIRSIEPEYLPKMGGDTVHLNRSQRLLDSQFRLLREDNIGCLRESLRQIIENRNNLDILQKHRRKNDGVKRFSSAGVAVLIHQNVIIEDISFSGNQGLKIGISFNQPIPNAKARDRRDWWANEKILDFNTLVCILNQENEAVFFTVCDRWVARGDIKGDLYKDEKKKEGGPILTLAEDPLRAGIILSFADAVREKDVKWLYKIASSYDSSKVDLIEFPRTLLASFRPILQGLQKRINKTQAIPFIDWLAPDPSIDFQVDDEGRDKVAVRPPPYALKPGFHFELNSIFTEKALQSLPLVPGSADFEIQNLLDRTTLDDGQAISLVKALSREVGLIQGPPGTGKSFVGTKLVKVLLESKQRASLGPIICVCYTNHALDQFLEHLLDTDVNSIIRLGSRSKSERLEPYLLRNLTQAAENTHLEKKEMWMLRTQMREFTDDASEYCSVLSNAKSEATLRSHIAENYPQWHLHLFQEVEDAEGFVIKRGKGKEKPFTAWRGIARPMGSGPSKRSFREVRILIQTTSDPWSLSPEERYEILRYWKAEMVRNATIGLASVTAKHHEASEKLAIVRKEWDRRTLQRADIIGVTTTSLALHADLLERIQAKVLFCEEAGEILEAHTITTLIPSIEQMILIGDHEQLRPHIANFDLSVESQKGQSYALDVSLFERLARQPYGNLALTFPIASLNTQRRMHPSIADLIRLKTYPSLLDKVPDYQRVPGMKKRLYWMNHTHPDSKGDAIRLTTSYDNEFEQEMVISLVNYLLRQGVFKEKQIAVLTPYLGQMSKLRRLLSNSVDIIVGTKDQEALEAEGFLDEDSVSDQPQTTSTVKKSSLAAAVRIATIDNFQGEEAEVVIISLVRSNKEGKCGFLKTSNRINVLLSRAKWGMYIIGNSQTAGSVPMWSQVIHHMNLQGCLGDTLELECERHKDLPIHVASQEDFVRYAPEGGCTGTSLAANFDVLEFAVRSSVADMFAIACVEIVASLLRKSLATSIPTMASAHRNAEGHSTLALILARRPVTVAATVAFAKESVKSVVLTPYARISMPCGVPCNMLPCDQLCSKALKCGHPCPSICGEKCPEPKYCRECATDAILDFQVDMIMMETYRESKDEPIIFLTCGHFYTVTSFDGIAGMKDFFEFDETEDWKIRRRFLHENSTPVLPRCPQCRAPFTTSARYNEIVKRAQLQNCIKQFTATSNERLLTLVNAVNIQEEELEASRGVFVPKKLENILSRQLNLRKVLKEIRAYNANVLVEEQPYHRVYELTTHACRKNNINPEDYNPSTVQYRFGMEGAYQEVRATLLQACDMDIIAGQPMTIPEIQPQVWKGIMALSRSAIPKCNRLIATCKNRRNHIIEIQARIVKAKFRILSLKHHEYASGNTKAKTDAEVIKEKQDVTANLQECLDICDLVPSCARLREAVAKTIKSIEDLSYFAGVTDKEMKAIYEAMAREFSGTGHWYTCPNGHPFTIGECGRAMQLGTCNECGARIGGQHHQSVAGVRNDHEIETRMARVNL